MSALRCLANTSFSMTDAIVSVALEESPRIVGGLTSLPVHRRIAGQHAESLLF